MTFDQRAYNREFMRKARAKKAWQKALAQGKCPVCSMLLKSDFHIRCKYLDKEDKTTPF
jgi:hypothetical protein